MEKLLESLEVSEEEQVMILEILQYKRELNKLESQQKDLERQLDRLSKRRVQIISSLEVLEEGSSDQQVRQEYVQELTTLDKKINEIDQDIEKIEVTIEELKESVSL